MVGARIMSWPGRYADSPRIRFKMVAGNEILLS